MHDILLLLAVLLALTPLSAQTGAPAASIVVERPIKTTLCAIKANPAAFQNKLVEVSGIASHGFEESMFEDLSCFWTVQGAPGIWMEYGGTAGTDTMYCCGSAPSITKKPLMVDGVAIPLQQDDTFKRFSSMLLPIRRKGVSVHATVQARIFAAHETLGASRSYWGGYGHMGCCILLAIERVVSIDSNKVGPSVYILLQQAAKASGKESKP